MSPEIGQKSFGGFEKRTQEVQDKYQLDTLLSHTTKKTSKPPTEWMCMLGNREGNTGSVTINVLLLLSNLAAPFSSSTGYGSVKCAWLR